MPGIDLPKSDDRILRERALRFAGVVLEEPGSFVPPRPEAVSGTGDDRYLKDRVDRFALRTRNSV